MGCVFCDLLSGKRKVQEGKYPFLPLRRTKNTVSFLSLDFPAHEDGHTLVVPRKHYKSLADVPKKILDELIEHSVLVSKAIRKNHQGCNILVNDGKFADQTIFHVHFHVIPRDKGDVITIDRWKHKKMSRENFDKLYKKMKKLIG
jgi:histidine triad (HIT) family protein